MKAKRDIGNYNFIFFLICNFLINMAVNMQGNTLALYALELGGDEVHVGMLSGIGSLMAMFFRPVVGNVLDRTRRSFIFVVGLGLYTLSTIGYIVSPNVGFLVISRGIYGLGLCAASSAIAAIVADLTKGKSNLVDSLQTVNVVNALGALLAPTIAIYLARIIGFSNMYVVTVVLMGAALAFASQLDYDWEIPIMRQAESGGFKKLEPMGWKVIIPSACMLLHGIPHSAIYGFMASYGLTIGVENIGFYYIVNGITTLAIKPFLRKYTGAGHRDKMFGIGIVFIMASALLFIPAKGVLLLILSAICFAFGYTMTQPTLNALALMSVPPERRGSANATYYLFWDFGYGASSVALGVLARQTGYHSIYIVGAVAAALLAVIYYRFIAGRYDD